MEFLAILMLSMGIFVSGSSGSQVCKCLEGDGATAAPTQAAADAIDSYKLTVKEGGEEHEEKITFDLNKQTETMHVEGYGNIEEADIISDFMQNLSMYRIPAKRICLLGPLDEKAKPPSEFREELEKEMKSPRTDHTEKRSTTNWRGVSQLMDRSVLSDEMASLCAKYPIYKIEQSQAKETVTKILSPRRNRRRGCSFTIVEVCRRCWIFFTCCRTIRVTKCGN